MGFVPKLIKSVSEARRKENALPHSMMTWVSVAKSLGILGQHMSAKLAMQSKVPSSLMRKAGSERQDNESTTTMDLTKMSALLVTKAPWSFVKVTDVLLRAKGKMMGKCSEMWSAPASTKLCKAVKNASKCSRSAKVAFFWRHKL